LVRSSVRRTPFGAAFTFTVSAAPKIRVMHNADTSKSDSARALVSVEPIEEMQLPRGCTLVGIELTDDAIDLPAFRHPLRAAYVMGGRRGTCRRAAGEVRVHREDPDALLHQCRSCGRAGDV